MLTHTLGFPRMGRGRELKKAMEGFFAGTIDENALTAEAKRLRLAHWELQRAAGLDLVAVGDFSLYDHVLDLMVDLDASPGRYGPVMDAAGNLDLRAYYRLARGGQGPTGDVPAMEMTKWFDTNYHYIVPEFSPDQCFAAIGRRLERQAAEAREAGYSAKVQLPGPLTFLCLGKSGAPGFDRFSLLPRLAEAYGQLLARLGRVCDWVQLDEPALALTLPGHLASPFRQAYVTLIARAAPARLMLATCFGTVAHNADFVSALPLGGLHLDLVRAPQQLLPLLAELSPWTTLSLGLVDGRNVWRVEAERALALARRAIDRLGTERLALAPSCSLMHVPLDLEGETDLDPEVRNWMAFALQKCVEVRRLADAAEGKDAAAWLAENRAAWQARRASAKTRNPAVRERAAGVTPDMLARSEQYAVRAVLQQAKLGLPPLPATTIGSFPQTPEIRAARRQSRQGAMSPEDYESFVRDQVRDAIARQEALGLDVLVHGEAERNDMVEFFGERLSGFCFTRNGWVQSYGARCVKPPVIFGDVSRPRPMTVGLARYAQALTTRPVKGMLTGPVTILGWSFVRDDQPRAATCRQIALALRDEVEDLERVGIGIIQVDEPALREGLPLRREGWAAYLDWAVAAFRLAVGGALPETQIHTHMCYCEFNDILADIAAMDADVISIEASRSRMELLEAFREFHYPNGVGPGVYDIHSPRVPSVEEMLALLRRAAAVIPAERLWVNPDCGLKTRAWPETMAALGNMVEAGRRLRAELGLVAG